MADGVLSAEVTGEREGHGERETLTLTGDRIFINTGAQAMLPPIAGLTETPGVYTSTRIMELEELPQRLVIIGGGYIGLEFASMFADFGSQVTVLQHSSRLLEREDDDIAQAVLDDLTAQGVRVLFNADTHESLGAMLLAAESYEVINIVALAMRLHAISP
ncbi:pyridine nucleotide-disulfide oxidoreductase [Bifidobacterium gallicum DSM 20093 = LMG 11596]|uniref:Pyridine nucleotide-disulfide oxidoreductase n=1 Tax=Bifidobacterium gallicum DSM 20093 = LMG 11596 TaxID=561180 RepID=D1NWK5_9BIFI|nr:FAD-dependent oxidoreductase [Bifidobacterium gallicum]EFA22491.1 pyridine nucleotide-disulfide oxidoreductase [Bifidobacterium gallicum DSM 20093 = LMG 11596]KFI58997.1 pyridine nucleotide-disulfide oxidoreductase family protein [Bifidobacterium gallicum DSM 20093 = LMG 11596]